MSGQRRRKQQFKEKGCKYDEDKAPAAKRRKFAFATSVRSKKKKRRNQKKVRRRTKKRCRQQRAGKFQRPTIMFYTYTRITCRYDLDKPSNNSHFKNTPVVHFSAFVELATKISALLPLWRLELSVYFHLGEYY